MKMVSMRNSSAALAPGARDVGVFSTHSARYRLKSYLRARGGTWAAIALAEAGDLEGAVELLADAPTGDRSPPA